jgi:hypothetical protein
VFVRNVSYIPTLKYTVNVKASNLRKENKIRTASSDFGWCCIVLMLFGGPSIR